MIDVIVVTVAGLKLVVSQSVSLPQQRSSSVPLQIFTHAFMPRQQTIYDLTHTTFFLISTFTNLDERVEYVIAAANNSSVQRIVTLVTLVFVN